MRRSRPLSVVLVLAVVLFATSVGAALPPGGTFSDDNGNIFEGAIEAIAAEGITVGCNPPTNDRFCPDDHVTRGEMAVFLVRAFGYSDNGGGNLFVDDDGLFYENAADRLKTAGVTLGCNPPANTRYCGEDRVTRGQMAAFVVRALQLTDDGGGNLYTDDDGSIFEGAIDRLGTAGITQGCNPPVNDRFCPDAFVTRGQMAAFLARALGLTPIKPPPPSPGGDLTVVFVAVRQGDAAVYQGACGETGLIDTNRFRSAEVLAVLDEVGTRSLKWVAVSHYDADHLGGILDVATAPGASVGTFYDRGGGSAEASTQTYAAYYQHVTNTGTRHPLDIGDSFSLCSGSQQVTFTVVSAGTDGTAAGGIPVTEENDKGLCLHVEYRDFDLATCGDINGTNAGSRSDVESAVASTIGDVEVAKVNHHGSAFSSNQTYVSTLSAEAAVISVGANSFGHPDPTIVSRWATNGVVFQTQSPNNNALIDGDITVTTDGITDFRIVGDYSGLTLSGALDES
jgi:beta-lactamase superfamily II metal-dependent hydrolase